MDARLFKLADHSGTKNKGKGIMAKNRQTVNPPTTASKRSGQITAKHSNFVNLMDGNQASTVGGHFSDSGNPSGSGSERFGNNFEHEDLMSPIPHQQMSKNQLPRTPSGSAQSRRSDISKATGRSGPSSIRHSQYVDLQLSEPDEGEDTGDDGEANINTDNEEAEDGEDVVGDDDVHPVTAGVKRRRLENFPSSSSNAKEKVFQVTVGLSQFII